MKKRKIILIVFILIIISILIPIKKSNVWVNDDEISDVGHYEECYYNIFGMNLSKFKIEKISK